MTLSCCLMVEAVNTLHLNWSAVTNQISFQLLFTCLTFSWLLHCQLVSSCFTFPLEIYCHTWSASLAVWSNYLSFSSFCFKVRQRWAFFSPNFVMSYKTIPLNLSYFPYIKHIQIFPLDGFQVFCFAAIEKIGEYVFLLIIKNEWTRTTTLTNFKPWLWILKSLISFERYESNFLVVSQPNIMEYLFWLWPGTISNIKSFFVFVIPSL